VNLVNPRSGGGGGESSDSSMAPVWSSACAPERTLPPLEQAGEVVRDRALLTVLRVNALTLAAVLPYNLLIQRPVFALAHAALLTVLALLLLGRFSGWLSRLWITRLYLGAAALYVLSFVALPQAAPYDVLWLMVFPVLAAFLVEHEQELRYWLIGFVATTTLLALVGLALDLVEAPFLNFPAGALFNLAFAAGFVSLLARENHRYRAQYEGLQRDFAETLQSRVQVATQAIQRLNDEIEATQRDVVLRLGEVCEMRSQETGQHVRRVSEYSGLLAEIAGLSTQDVELVRDAAPLHDTGKVAVPDAILNKPGRLTPDEFAVMQRHTEYGYQMLSGSTRPLLKAAATIALEHHERWDGTGYPRHLAGEDIHLFARIVALADVFDALSFARVYKPAWSDESIRDLFAREAGQHFDPQLAALFLQHFEAFIAIRNRLADRQPEPEPGRQV